MSFVFCPARAQQSQNVRLRCNWNDTAHIAANNLGARYNDCWGFTWQGLEYGVIGSTEGGHVIDINNCRQAAFLPAADSGAFIVHRDYKTYGHYLYAVADEGFSKLQVFDFSYLPDSVHLVYESDPADFTRCHNIFIDTATAKLYACSVNGNVAPRDYMRIYSLANPVLPTRILTFNYGDYVHDVYVRNDTAYASCSNFGYLVLDCRGPGAPAVIGGLLTYPYQGYNHSSWIGADGIGVMADETHGLPLKVIDTHNLLDIQVTATFSPRDTERTCIPHNPYVRGHYAYISYYFDGLQIYDLSDPRNPRQAGFYDTYPGESFVGYSGAWGCYPFLPSGRILASDMQTGLYVLDADEATGTVRSKDITIFPNPAEDFLSINLPAPAGSVSLAVYDMAGRLVLRDMASGASAPYLPLRLPLPASLQTGWYVLKISAGNQAGARRFFKR